MKPSVQAKLQSIVARHDELKRLLSDPQVVEDLNRYRDLSKEYSQLEPFVQLFASYQNSLSELEDAKVML